MTLRLKRRRFLHGVAAGSAALALGPAVLGQGGGSGKGALTAERLSDTLSLIRGAGGNVLVKRAPDGQLLAVDGGLRQHAAALLDLIGRHMGSDNITLLANTHWHREQTGLNRPLGERGVEIFAHENTRQWLSIEVERLYEDRVFEPLPAFARPSRTFYHYGRLNHAGVAMRYGYLRQAHTDGDMYALFPDDNVVHAGGVLSSAGWPRLDWWTGGWIGGLVEAIDTLLDVCDGDTRIVPADGPVMTRAEAAEHQEMYAAVFERVRELFRDARGPDETVAAKPAAEFEDRMGNSDTFVLQAHRSVLAHYAPDA